MSEIKNRILIHSEIGNIACGDIYCKINNQSKLTSEELDLDETTQIIFENNSNIVMQLWDKNEFVYLATKVYSHKRLIRIKKGNFDEFEFHEIQPAKGTGGIELRITNSNYYGYILKGKLNLNCNLSFNELINKIEKELLPEITNLFNGKITKRRKYHDT